MNGASVMGLRRGLITNKCITSQLLQFQSWNWSYSKSVPSSTSTLTFVPSASFGQTVTPSSKSTYSKNHPLAPTEPEEHRPLLEKGHGPGESSKAVSLCFQYVRGLDPVEVPKSQILHKVLDVIALNMESTGRCLDFHDLMPMDQEFRCQDPNLRCLKAIVVKEVEHLTMVLVLDEDHTHYSNAFGNIFKSGALSKKQFPKGSDGIKTKRGGPAQAIMCHFCLHACSNDDYAYHHLAAIHLNIQWGCRTCHGYVSGYLSKIREHVQSHLKKSSRE